MVSTVTPERRPVGDWAMGAIETLVFDVLGTVVDETASVVLEVEAAMVDAGLVRVGDRDSRSSGHVGSIS